MKKVKIGVIGCGKVAERMHLPEYQKLKSAEVVALADVNLENAGRLASAFKVPVIVSDYRHLLKLEHIDAVSVCTPNYLHCRMTCEALAAGKHALVEKPAATSMGEVRRMSAAARRAKKILMVSQNHRFIPINAAARDFIKAGKLGKIFAFRGRVAHAGPEFWSPGGKWFFDSGKAFGGALADIGIHITDALRWITGKDARSVVAFTRTLRKKCSVDDNSSLIVECKDGTLGTIEASWTQNPGELTYTIYGDKGNLVNDNYRKLIFYPKNKKPVEVKIPERLKESSPYEHFVNCILKRRKPMIDGIEGGKSLEILLAAYKSSKTGRAVRLPLR